MIRKLARDEFSCEHDKLYIVSGSHFFFFFCDRVSAQTVSHWELKRAVSAPIDSGSMVQDRWRLCCNGFALLCADVWRAQHEKRYNNELLQNTNFC